MDRRPPDFSRINEDGTPFQFALSLGPRNPALQFLSEVWTPRLPGAKRILLSRERIGALGNVLGIHEAVLKTSGLLDKLGAPDGSGIDQGSRRGILDWSGLYSGAESAVDNLH